MALATRCCRSQCHKLPKQDLPHDDRSRRHAVQMLQTELGVAKQQLEDQEAEYDEVSLLPRRQGCLTLLCAVMLQPPNRRQLLLPQRVGMMLCQNRPTNSSSCRSWASRRSCMRTAASSNSSSKRSCR